MKKLPRSSWNLTTRKLSIPFQFCLRKTVISKVFSNRRAHYEFINKLCSALIKIRWTSNQEGFRLVSSQTQGTLSKTKTTIKVVLFCNKKLPESSEIRTFCVELHEATKLTPTGFFKQIQEINIYFNN